MSVELWMNNARSSLAAAISPSDTSFSVASGQGARFPNPTAGDYFWATIDNGSVLEIIKVTARSTDSFSTVVRAQQGTTALAWNTGTRIELRITKSTMEALQVNASIAGDTIWENTGDLAVGTGASAAQVLPVGSDGDLLTADSGETTGLKWAPPTGGVFTSAYGSRPSPTNAGNLFFPSDGFYVERDTGAAWAPWGPLFPFTAPDDSAFSWVNQGSATKSTTNGGIHISAPSNGSAQSARLRAKTLPSAPYTLTVALLPLLHYAQFSIVLFGLRNSSDDKMVLFQIENDSGTLTFQYTKWTNVTTPAGAYISITNATPMPDLPILRLQDDNTNRILSWSADGQNFMPIHSVGRTDHTTPDQAVIGVNPFSQVTGVTLLSWKETV